MTLLPGSSSHRSFAYQRDRFPLSYKLQKFLLPKLTHLVLVCFIVIVVYSEAKELHRSSAQTWFFLTAHVTTMLCFFLAASLDPGYVSRESVRDVLESLGSSSPSRNGKSSLSAADLESDSSCSEDEVFLQSREFSKKPLVSNPPRLSYKNKPVSFRKCNYCEMLQPLRAKHCEECGRCVRKYDHHCPWLGNCVGEKNHKFFWALLSTGAITVCYTLNLTYHAFHSPPSATIPEYVRLNVLLIIVFVLEALFLFFDLVLLGAHTYLMASNQTSWEFMARSRITYLRDLSSEDNPFDRGLVRNCWQFLCNWRASNWESYFTNLSSTVNTCVSSVIQTGQGVAAAACNPSMTTPHYYSKLETNDYDEQEHQIPSEGQRRGFSVQKPSSSVNSLAPELIGDESSSESSTGNKTSSKWNEANNSSLSYSVVNVEGNEDGFAEVNVDDSGHGGSSDLNCSNI